MAGPVATWLRKLFRKSKAELIKGWAIVLAEISAGDFSSIEKVVRHLDDLHDTWSNEEKRKHVCEVM